MRAAGQLKKQFTPPRKRPARVGRIEEGSVITRFLEISAALMAFGLAVSAQTAAPAKAQHPLKTAAYAAPQYQDQDQRRRDWDLDRDRAWHREHRGDWDDARDRDWHRDHDRDRDHYYGQGRWQGRLSAEDQSRFNSYYSRWQQYRATNNRQQMASMEERMRNVYSHYGIPNDVPFDDVASGGRRY
jgi:hypothetical protein